MAQTASGESQTRDSFTSRTAFIIACIGSAVGLSGIWLFPYRVSQLGGAAFLIPYLFFVVLLGLTGVVGEMSFGRAMGCGPMGAFGKALELRGVPNATRIGKVIGIVPVLADPDCACRAALRPDALVDAILAKHNLGTRITDAPIVVGVGPGFTAGEDCHAVVETMRGHTLGRVIYSGSALPNTNIPGLIGGFAGERVLRAPADGEFRSARRIGDLVKAGDVAGYVAGEPMVCTIDGVLRGLIADGVPVCKGMKSGDVDPRGNIENCYTASDKALAVGGGVLEALLHLSGALEER